MDLQELLNKWNIKCDIKTILSMWNESHRHYHTLDHLNDIIDQINENKSKFDEMEYEKLLLTAIFHDCVYDPMSSQNEEKSANFLLECAIDKKNEDILEIYDAIIDTKNHDSDTELAEVFNQFDMNIVERNFDELLEWENGIYEEFKIVGDIYKENRLLFLESLLDKYPNNTENLLNLINWVKVNYK